MQMHHQASLAFGRLSKPSSGDSQSLATPNGSLRLPRGASCIEMDDVRAAHARCLPSAPAVWPTGPRIVCPRSKEALCSSKAAPMDAVPCGTQSPPSGDALGWEHVAFGVATFESEDERKLIQMAADTWLRMVPGAGLMIATDRDDSRSDDDILPRTDGAVAVHVHRCDVCCGKRSSVAAASTCVVEGWLCRSKVLSMFGAMAERWAQNKSFFFKLDADSSLAPHNLLALLHELHEAVGTSQSYVVGLAACRSKGPLASLCHAAGGAGYGLSRGALLALRSYHAREYPAFLKTVDAYTYGGEDAAVAYALSQAAEGGAALINCGAFHQMRPDMYASLPPRQVDYIRWPLTSTPVSFHTFKHPSWLRRFHDCVLYERDDATPRCFLPAAYAHLQNGSCAAERPRLSPTECAAAAAALVDPPRLGESEADDAACDELPDCAACVGQDPLPPPFDAGARCVWCPSLRACRTYQKRSRGSWPCRDAIRAGGGYPGGNTCPK